MTDNQITELLWMRDEGGIEAVKQAYGALAEAVALRIVGNPEDAEECVQDGLMALWNSIPPQRPQSLKHYFLRLVRNSALDRWRASHRDKRGGGVLPAVLEELDSDVPSTNTVEDAVAEKLLSERINVFLRGLSKRERTLFLKRYYYMEELDTIAASLGIPKTNASVMLFRTRKKLRDFLKKEDLL